MLAAPAVRSGFVRHRGVAVPPFSALTVRAVRVSPSFPCRSPGSWRRRPPDGVAGVPASGAGGATLASCSGLPPGLVPAPSAPAKVRSGPPRCCAGLRRLWAVNPSQRRRQTADLGASAVLRLLNDTLVSPRRRAVHPHQPRRPDLAQGQLHDPDRPTYRLVELRRSTFVLCALRRGPWRFPSNGRRVGFPSRGASARGLAFTLEDLVRLPVRSSASTRGPLRRPGPPPLRFVAPPALPARRIPVPVAVFWSARCRTSRTSSTSSRASTPARSAFAVSHDLDGLILSEPCELFHSHTLVGFVSPCSPSM
jgi:hypothetical protein